MVQFIIYFIADYQDNFICVINRVSILWIHNLTTNVNKNVSVCWFKVVKLDIILCTLNLYQWACTSDLISLMFPTLFKI